MGWTVVQVLTGLVILTIGAEGLVRGGAALALRFRISPLVIGLTIVAFGTSAPELWVSVRASLDGRSSIALGNVLGSNVFNVAAILGLVALISPIRCSVDVIRREIPWMCWVTLLLLAAVIFGGRPDPEMAGVIGRGEGAVFVALCAGYLVVAYRAAATEGAAVMNGEPLDVAPPHSANALRRERPWLSTLLILGGLAFLMQGSDMFVSGAVRLAKANGLSDLVIGVTIVGAGTSLPELATSIVAALRRQPDLALGNVVGSNILNILGILGASALVHPLTVERDALVRDLPAALILALLLIPMSRTGRRIARLEGALMLTMFAVHLALVLTW